MRTRSQRPRSRAAEQTDELAPFRVEHGDFLPYAPVRWFSSTISLP
jgi:hypothetical protein